MSEVPKILVIEDDPTAAELMVFLLKHHGYAVTTAWEGRAGLALARTGEFDLITLDVILPDICGFDVFEELKREPSLAKTPVVFVSGTTEECLKRAFAAGAVDFIVKPFKPEDFMERLHRWIRKPAAVASGQ